MTVRGLFNKVEPVLYDGANGSLYQERGIPPGTLPELLNLDRPQLVRQVHREYLNAGSIVIETNTFGANRKRLEAAGVGGRIADINRIGVELALKEADGRALVAGSVGPLGMFLQPYGDVTAGEAMEAFGEQVRFLLGAGVHFVQIETMMSLQEALLALKAAQEAGASYVGVSMTFEPTPNGPRSPFGESPAEAAGALLAGGAAFVGSNCGKGLEVMREIVRDFLKTAPPEKVLVQPNAGIPEVIGGTISYPESAEKFALFVKEMLSLGIRYLGGCCGTTPQHIAAARRIIDSMALELSS